MMQQINLYSGLPKHHVSQLTPIRILQLFGIVFVLSLCLVGYGDLRELILQSRFDALQKKETATLDRLITTSKKHQTSGEENKLKAEIKSLTKRVKQKQLVIQHVQRTGSKTITGFSSYLIAIAKSIPADTWLTEVSLRLQGNEVTISGRTLRSASVPEFITRLTQEQPFSKREFDFVKVEQHEESTRYFRFTVSDKAHAKTQKDQSGNKKE